MEDGVLYVVRWGLNFKGNSLTITSSRSSLKRLCCAITPLVRLYGIGFSHLRYEHSSWHPMETIYGVQLHSGILSRILRAALLRNGSGLSLATIFHLRSSQPVPGLVTLRSRHIISRGACFLSVMRPISHGPPVALE